MEIEEKSLSEVQLLPCTINYNGPAPIESYFIKESSLINEEKEEELISNFRGRKLIGKVVKLPENINGYVLESFNKSNINIHSKFNEIIVWEHDIQPDTQLVQNSIDWFDIADIVSQIIIIMIIIVITIIITLICYFNLFL